MKPGFLFVRASALMLLQFAIAAVALAATEMGQYPAGAFGQMKVGILPPPGFVLENGTLAYTAREFVNGDGTTQELDTTVLVNRTLGMWTTDWKLLGADFAVAAAIPHPVVLPT